MVFIAEPIERNCNDSLGLGYGKLDDSYMREMIRLKEEEEKEAFAQAEQGDDTTALDEEMDELNRFRVICIV